MGKGKQKLNLREHMHLLNELQVDGEGEWPHVGRDTGWPVYDELVGSTKDRLYLFAGGAGCGKSSFVTQIFFNLLTNNEDMVGLFFSMDLAYLDLVARLYAISSRLTLEQVRDPSIVSDEDDLVRREEGLKVMESLQDRVVLVDQSHGIHSLDDVIEQMQNLRKDNPNSPMVVAIDPVSNLRTSEPGSRIEKVDYIVSELKSKARLLSTAILLSSPLISGTRKERPHISALEPQSSLVYDTDLVALLYSDVLTNGETPFLEWEFGTEDLMVPIVEMNVVKNKNASFMGRLFYRFFQSGTRYKECGMNENSYYNEMIGNLDYFTDPKAKKSDLKKRVYKAPKREYEGNF
tara:strand:+ start:160 stop:1203 length:1044 start_codon:yes stop_codon:yes gene_type:complete